MMKVYIGIDLASATMGLVVMDINGNLLSATRNIAIKSDKYATRWDRYGVVLEPLAKVLVKYEGRIAKIAIEGYGGRFKSSLIPGVECGTFARLMIENLGLTPHMVEVAPTSLKKFATGNGAAKKDMVIARVYQKYNWMPPDADQADAYVLARMAIAVTYPSEIVLNYEKDVIKVVIHGRAKKRTCK